MYREKTLLAWGILVLFYVQGQTSAKIRLKSRDVKVRIICFRVMLKGHCHEYNFKNSTAQKHVYTIGNLLTEVKFS